MTQEQEARRIYEEAVANCDQLILDKINAGLERREAEDIVARDLAGLRTRCDNLKAVRLLNGENRAAKVAAVMAEVPADGEVLIYG